MLSNVKETTEIVSKYGRMQLYVGTRTQIALIKLYAAFKWQ